MPTFRGVKRNNKGNTHLYTPLIQSVNGVFVNYCDYEVVKQREQQLPENINFTFSKPTMYHSSVRNTFRKHEKICNQKQIDRLFNEGKTLSSGKFRMLFLETETAGNSPVQVLIAVPKKNLRLSVSRNRMKRLLRESYRLNKHKILDFFAKKNIHCDIAIIFTGKKCVSMNETITAINILLDRLISTHEKDSE